MKKLSYARLPLGHRFTPSHVPFRSSNSEVDHALISDTPADQKGFFKPSKGSPPSEIADRNSVRRTSVYGTPEADRVVRHTFRVAARTPRSSDQSGGSASIRIIFGAQQWAEPSGRFLPPTRRQPESNSWSICLRCQGVPIMRPAPRWQWLTWERATLCSTCIKPETVQRFVLAQPDRSL
jgi:hypothetical protein